MSDFYGCLICIDFRKFGAKKTATERRSPRGKNRKSAGASRVRQAEDGRNGHHAPERAKGGGETGCRMSMVWGSRAPGSRREGGGGQRSRRRLSTRIRKSKRAKSNGGKKSERVERDGKNGPPREGKGGQGQEDYAEVSPTCGRAERRRGRQEARGLTREGAGGETEESKRGSGAEARGERETAAESKATRKAIEHRKGRWERKTSEAENGQGLAEGWRRNERRAARQLGSGMGKGNEEIRG